MTLTSTISSFAIVAGVVTVTPGLDTALVLHAAITRGVGRAMLAGLGICAGALIWGASAAAGASALLSRSPALFQACRMVGAVYLVWMGCRLLRAATNPRARASAAAAPHPIDSTRLSSFRHGFLTNLLNPKVGAFYAAVLPQFLPEHIPPLLMGVLLAMVHDAETMLWFLLIASVGARASRWLSSRRTLQVIEVTTGLVLLASGAGVALVTG